MFINGLLMPVLTLIREGKISIALHCVSTCSELWFPAADNQQPDMSLAVVPTLTLFTQIKGKIKI